MSQTKLTLTASALLNMGRWNDATPKAKTVAAGTAVEVIARSGNRVCVEAAADPAVRGWVDGSLVAWTA